MALDGILDPALSPVTLFTDNARGYEDALTRFAAWCAQTTSCALHGQDVLGVYDQLVQQADRRTQGFAEAWSALVGCMNWPEPVAYPPHRAHVHGAPPILLVNATHYPSTPYVWAQDVRAQIPGAVLLTRDGDGHTSSWLPHSQTRNATARYLIARKPPPANTVLPD